MMIEFGQAPEPNNKRSDLIEYIEDCIKRFSEFNIKLSINEDTVPSDINQFKIDFANNIAMVRAYTNCLERIKALNSLD